MRIALLLNPTAGDGEEARHLPARLAHHGHELVCVVEEEAEAPLLVQKPCDLVVAAGGDGTVAVVARTIIGHQLPLAILPLGTANNIALTLGLDGSIDDLIEAWRAGQRRPLDYGIARGPWGDRLFIESVGVGLIGAGIADAYAMTSRDAERASSSLPRTAQIYREALSRLQPSTAALEVDGTRIDGEFLLIEVLNIPFVGPNLVFAADTDASDGLLSVVVARSEQRQQLDDYLRHRMEGTDCPTSLVSHGGRRIDLDTTGAVHVDDEIYSLEAGGRVSVDIGDTALDVVV